MIEKYPIFDLCKEKVPEGQPYCSLCSRLRRGKIYGIAREIGANKIALGHHKDDVLATFFLNFFYSGIIKSMPPILRTDKDDLTVIRPLVYCRERDLKKLATLKQYRLLPKGLCGSGRRSTKNCHG